MSQRIPALFLLLFSFSAAVGCITTNSVGRSVETVVPAGVLTYEIVAPTPFSLRVENKGDAPVEVFVREEPEGPERFSLRLSHGASSTTALTLARCYVSLSASQGPSFVHLSVIAVAPEGEPAPDPPTLRLHGRSEL